jgi:beta-phosphoglucomutase-like phosphatase (HAD superfamily)
MTGRRVALVISDVDGTLVTAGRASAAAWEAASAMTGSNDENGFADAHERLTLLRPDSA